MDKQMREKLDAKREAAVAINRERFIARFRSTFGLAPRDVKHAPELGDNVFFASGYYMKSSDGLLYVYVPRRFRSPSWRLATRLSDLELYPRAYHG